MEIKPSSVIRGQGLCKHVAESASLPEDNTNESIDKSFLEREINFFPSLQNYWYSDIRFLLEIGNTPDILEQKKLRK